MWTEERIALLQKLWGQGYSASQIASQLPGVTRNAVIGKIHRLGKRPESATPRARPALVAAQAAAHARRRPVAADARRTAPAPQPQPQPDWTVRPFRRPAILPGEPGLATSTTLEANMCRWPIGDPDEAGFSFCGRGVEGSRPYCQGHSRLAYKGSTGGEADINRLYARYL
ncbi:MAG TPA: GcrA family cell cycle regulator [Caulobacteraceae bacterium]|jgi:GcrA cell cycle regulator